jgi:type I restriction enzyme, S subunit
MIEYKTLKEISTFIKTGKTPPTKELKYFEGEINWFTPGDLDLGKKLFKARRTLTKIAFDEKKAIQFPKGTLLVGCIGDIGKLGITTELSSSNQQLTGILPNEKVEVNYLYYWFKASKTYLGSIANNAVVPILNNSQLEIIKIPLPPLDQQKKIASILDAADAYRQKTKALLAKYDELTQSLFLDMFGDPVKNEKGWEKVQATKYYEVRGRVGWKGYKKTDLRESGAIVIGATHVTNKGDLDLSKIVYLSEEKFIESPEIIVNKNDLIFVQRGNTIGKVCLVRNEIGKATINPVVLIFRPIKANSYFLLYLLLNKELNREFVNSNSGSAQPMITQKTMKEFMFIDVPLTLQNQFAERVQAIEQQKASAQASYEKAEELFNSLLQKAFKGELV